MDGTLRQPGSDRHRNASYRRAAKGDLSHDDDDVEERDESDEEDEAKDEAHLEHAEAQPAETVWRDSANKLPISLNMDKNRCAWPADLNRTGIKKALQRTFTHGRRAE